MGGTLKVIKWIVGSLLVIGFVIAGAGVFLYPQIKDAIKASRGELGEEVRLEAVEPGRLVRTVSAPGEIEPVRNVKISARITAEIVAIPFEEGDRVHAGDIVLKLNDRDLKAGLDATYANFGAVTARLAGAQATYVNANADWERSQSLFKTDDVSQADLDAADSALKRAESELRAAEKNVDSAKADVARTEENLKYAEIRSPIDGRVTKVNAEVGELVVTGTMNNQGTVILEIADLSEMIVKTEVDESDVAPVREGQSARIHINAYPGEVFEGRVVKVALQHSFAADRSKYYETEVLLIPKDDRTIFSGLTANVDIEVETIEDVILAPSQAVLDARIDELPLDIANSPYVNHDKTFARIVYRFIDGKAVATPVRIGSSDLRSTVILGGLETGQEIVIGPWAKLQNLENGASIRAELTEEEQQARDAQTAVAADTDDQPTAKEPPAQSEPVASRAG
jgi:HlyD family secretion protein